MALKNVIGRDQIVHFYCSGSPSVRNCRKWNGTTHENIGGENWEKRKVTKIPLRMILISFLSNGSLFLLERLTKSLQIHDKIKYHPRITDLEPRLKESSLSGG